MGGVLSTKQLLAKATLSLSDFDGGGEAPLTIEQADEFLRIALLQTAMLNDVRTVRSKAAKWQESKLDFSNRIMRAGTEGVRLASGDRVKPTTGIVEISTSLIRGEVPITDEVMEDQVEQAGFGDTVMTQVAEASGRDVEELLINGDTGSGDTYLAQLNGWVVDSQGAGGNVTDATSLGQDYKSIFADLLQSIGSQFKRDLANWRYYVPQPLLEKYREQLADRGTRLGDEMLEGLRPLKFQSIEIRPVPILAITAGSPDTSFILLTHRQNLYAGIKRDIRMETYRDPREGVTSFIVTARVDAQIGVREATAIATNVNVEP